MNNALSQSAKEASRKINKLHLPVPNIEEVDEDKDYP